MNHTLPSNFDELREGDRFLTPSRTIEEGDVMSFAEVSGDHHPLHVDAAWAADSVFGEQIAHGLLVFSCAAGLVPFDPERVVALRRVSELVFKQPVRFGESISVEGKVRRVRPLEQGFGIVEVVLRVLRGDGRLALRAVLEVIWRRGEDVGIAA
jgi:3-hydroxybutyryl-CoA dehydratase